MVGIITPWNGPFSLAINPTVQAILAGNAVILKPSEVSPHSSEWAVRLLTEAGVPEGVVQVLHGDGETGAAGGAVFNSMLNSGHVCMGVERVYVVESIADEFEERVKSIVSDLRYGTGEEVDLGSVFWDRQMSIIERHVEDARAKGAEIVVGGEADTTDGAQERNVCGTLTHPNPSRKSTG